MNVEETLRKAIDERVAEVRPPAGLAQAVRRRRARRRTWYGVAAVAAATAVIAGAFPAYQALTAPPQAPVLSGGGSPDPALPTPGGVEPALPSPGVSAPDGKRDESTATFSPETGPFEVTATAEPEATPAPAGDGREYGGIAIGHIPGGLKWNGQTLENTFGSAPSTYSRMWGVDGEKWVQVIVYRGAAVGDLAARLAGYREQGAKPIRINGHEAFQVRTGEAMGLLMEKGQPVLAWTQPGYGIEILSHDVAESEVRAVAESIETK
ncbi:hypothetical protein [Bailinhaonella thermotolerans]|uniref:DUF4367 domain-containing protein n=1 Tax=Bailinhaonella thermotolerans TaxID=1070861 RepID=A0A3A4BHM3_9ACTN|nr:hypothetical protein [Bailinhaonella thermotolerans]RJL30762.1 hypothetical protein D5H75_20805 [Bailinhaonella thermotolerans]